MVKLKLQDKYGENTEWKQERVKQFFAEDELLIGKDYWNFVCDDPEGFDIVLFSKEPVGCPRWMAGRQKFCTFLAEDSRR